MICAFVYLTFYIKITNFGSLGRREGDTSTCVFSTSMRNKMGFILRHNKIIIIFDNCELVYKIRPTVG